MERGHEAETQESSAVALGRLGGLVRSGAKRGANRKGGLVKSRKKRIAARQRASSTPRSPQEIIAAMIASIRARFGNRVIGLGHQGIRFAGPYRQRDVADAHPAQFRFRAGAVG
jgi:hypothetical protein